MKKLLFLLPLTLFAFFVPNDDEYFVHKDSFGTLIYTKEDIGSAKKALNRFVAIQNLYAKSYGYKPRSAPFLVLASSKNQIANAWATAIPYPEVAIYGAGASEIDYFGYHSWIDTIVAHESAHIYQLDNKGDFGQKLESVLGHNYMPIFPVVPVPIFTKPNIFAPDFLLEGNALYNESKLTNAGRLFGGRHKALLLALAKSGKLNANRLINNHRDFPYLEEKYIVGGFFQAFLESEKLNGDKFFATNGEHFVNPLLLNSSFVDSYGAGFYDLLDRFLKQTQKEAESFVEQDGRLIGVSKVYAPIGSNKDEIWLYKSDLKTSSQIIKIEKNSKRLSFIKGDFLTGKPFCFDEVCTTRSSGYTSVNKIETGLFDKNQKPIKRFNGLVVQDFYSNQVLYFDTKKSFDKPALYQNGKFVSHVNASSKYTPDGKICLIRDGSLVCDNKTLFTLKSHFVIADIASDGSVLFTAPTAYGNSLFVYTNGKIYRALRGDNILDARFLDNKQLIISSVTANGYEYKLTKLEFIEELPKRAIFAFEKEPKLDISSSKDISLKDEKYSSIKMLKFSNLYPFLYITDQGVEGSLEANFVDPLMHNQLNLGYIHGEKAYGYGGYHNQKYRLFFGATYFKELNASEVEGERDFGAEIYAGYQLHKDNTKETNLIYKKIYDPDWDTNEPNILTLNYRYATKQRFAYKEDKMLDLALFYKENGKEERANGYKAEIGGRVIGSIFAEASYKHSSSTNGYIIAQEAKPIKDPLNFELVNMPVSYGSSEITSAKGTLSLAVESPLYFTAIPLGLHRFAPLASYERMSLGKTKYIVEEKVYALDFELLFAHRFDFAVEIGVAQNSEAEDKFYAILKAEF